MVGAISAVAVAVVGFTLNTITLVVFYRRPALRSPSNRFVLSLIGANLLTVLTLTPLAVCQLLMHHPSPVLTVTKLIVETLTVTTSALSTLAVSLDRYNAVLSPLHYTINITSQRSRCLITLVWLVSAVFSCPAYCRSEVCLPGYDQVLQIVYSSGLFTLAFALPLLTLFRVYVEMYEAAHRNSERTRRQSTSDSSRGGSVESQLPPTPVITNGLLRSTKAPSLAQLSKRRASNTSISALLFREEGRAVKTAAMVIATFMFSWGPFFSILLAENIFQSVPESFQYVALICSLFSTVLSPLLYVYRNEIARFEAMRILCWWQKRGLYRGNVLHQACKDGDIKTIESGNPMGQHPASASYCESMSVQSFSLTTAFSPECRECAEISRPPVADFVATYEVLEENVNELTTKTRGESVTFKLAMMPQKKCVTCLRQNSDSSSGSGNPLLREVDSPIPGTKRFDSFSRASSSDYSPTHGRRRFEMSVSINTAETKRPNTLSRDSSCETPNTPSYRRTYENPSRYSYDAISGESSCETLSTPSHQKFGPNTKECLHETSSPTSHRCYGNLSRGSSFEDSPQSSPALINRDGASHDRVASLFQDISLEAVNLTAENALLERVLTNQVTREKRLPKLQRLAAVEDDDIPIPVKVLPSDFG